GNCQMAMARPPQTAYSISSRSIAAISFVSSSYRSSIEHLRERALGAPERLIELVRIFAACLCEVGFAAAFAADDWGELADQHVRGDAVDEVLRHGGQQRHLSLVRAAEDDDAAL